MFGRSGTKTEKMELVSHAEPMYQESHGTQSSELQEISTSSNNFGNSSRSPPELSAQVPSQKSWSGGLRRLLDTSNSGKGIERYGLSIFQTFFHYIWNDLFTTLLTAPRLRFILIFFAVYFAVYFTFAIIYIMFPGSCMNDTSRDFGHTFWFSFNTASTIGYSGDLYPNPDCDLFYLIIMVEIITATMLDYLLMGVVFARFSAPLPKAQAIRFSTKAVLYQHQERQNLWCLSFRIANIRKHCLLSPKISLLLAVPESSPDSSNAALRFIKLDVWDVITQVTNIKLGLPATIVHLVTPSSPLFDISLEQMEQRGFELFCFLDGMDPMTSNSLQARHSYRPADIRINEQFTVIELQANKHGQMGLNFNQFDQTAPARKPDMDPKEAEHLRSQTFRNISVLDVGAEWPGPPINNCWGGRAESSLNRVEPAGSNVVHNTSNKGYPVNGLSHQPWMDFGAQSSGSPEASHAIQSLIEGVLGDSTASASLKRFAALAKADQLSARLGHQKLELAFGDSSKQQLPLSVMPGSFSQGGSNTHSNTNFMNPG
ncbi:hypothetical protein CEUSTIGMA_g3627.t1 [Chlamydomonas eustigma]|uniref:Inward rectifier potassium channel C-terminal domain-containing protein n=1 Tax=Chlamydomonas eustigma TaxID=1157962 RepID=A0A250WZB3_9CHLO|nr:hypothetical protein CEUSTIGMA_g3627.t1 [Chlamydomonas eustigma]|eukprot:GAX76183.1 hypothetical protein CEUSTIGMA_g3627.t1 [Chlamydomonas eustigma]